MFKANNVLSRRTFLLQSSAAAAATMLLPDAAAPLSAQEVATAAPKVPTRDTLLKFNADGTRKPFAGNTVICHMPVQCAMRDAMVELREALLASSFRAKLGPTSVDSYHMTVFPGANDQGRSASGWPSYVPADATIDACSRAVGERMVQAHLACALPIRVRVDEAETMHHTTACTLRMVPVDAEEEKKLRSVRDQLSEIYGFRLKDHATYGFHITMSYQVAPFSEEEQIAYRALLATHIPRIVEAQPVLELGNPEYCTFPDMFRFNPVKFLRCS